MKFPHPKVLHIIGEKNSGKTTVTHFLIQKLTAQNYRVGTFKHSSHSHPLDKAGSDSDLFRRAGASPSAFGTPQGMAFFFNALTNREKTVLLENVYQQCDLVLFESFREAEGPKILIGKEKGYAEDIAGIIAVVNKAGRHPDLPAFRFEDQNLVAFVINKIIQK